MNSDTRNKVPPYDKLMMPTIRALKALGGSGTIEEIEEKVVELEGYPPEVVECMHNNGRMPLLLYRLAWSRSYLKKAGALDNASRGVWTLTDVGDHLTEEECKKIPSAVNREWNKNKKLEKDNEVSVIEPSEETFATEDIDWKEELLKTLCEIEPDAFERLCQRLLREAGFVKVEVTGKSGDGGIDGIGILRMNLVSFKVLFQSKRYKGSVGSGAIRDFRGAMQGRCDKGLVISTGTFTAEAKREATRDGAPTVDLIDGEALCDLLRDLGLGVSVKKVETVQIDQPWFSSL